MHQDTTVISEWWEYDVLTYLSFASPYFFIFIVHTYSSEI